MEDANAKRQRKKAEKAIIWLSRNLNSELRMVRFYEDNLHIFDSAEEKNSIKKLVTDSLTHAKMLVELKHRLEQMVSKSPSRIKGKIRNRQKLMVLANGMREEKAIEGIYKYEARKSGSREIAKTLLRIAEMEVEHQRIVRRLAAPVAVKISKSRAEEKLRKLGI